MEQSGVRVFGLAQEKVETAVLSGAEFDPVATAYSANDLVLDLLREEGIWERLVSVRPGVASNGKDFQKVLGILAIKELLHVGRLQHIGKILRDANLMAGLGFTLEEVEEKGEKDRGIIHRDTARNHLKKIAVDESVSDFYRFVGFMRGKRWIRGGLYAADGFEMEVFGKGYPGAGKVWVADEKRWKRGYKAVLLMNIAPGRERLVGFALGPIQADERVLLRQIFEDLKKHVAPPSDMIDTLVLDRGFFGWDFFEELKNTWKLHFVLIAKKNLLLTQEMAWLSQSGQLKFQNRSLKGEEVQIAFAQDVMYGYESKEKPYRGKLNCVAVRYPQPPKEGKPREPREVIYLTDMSVRKNPLKIPKYYKARWTIENQGIRELSQVWKVRQMPGRTLNAITARLCLVLKLYNALKILEMKYPKDTETLKKEMMRRGERSWLSGRGIILYVGALFAVVSERQFKGLLGKRKDIEWQKKIRDVLRAPPGEREKLLGQLVGSTEE